MLAYLVIREGGTRTDVFRLIPGQTVTIGRAETNAIVIRDDQCSRYHAEIFQSNGRWTVRDLGSRNGTEVQEERLTSEHILEPGEVVRIGRCQLAFVHELSKAFPDSSSLIVKQFSPDYQPHGPFGGQQNLRTYEPTNIIARLAEPPSLEELPPLNELTQEIPSPKSPTSQAPSERAPSERAPSERAPSEPAPQEQDQQRQALPQQALGFLAWAMVQPEEPQAVAEAALDSLLKLLRTSGAGILVFPPEAQDSRAENELEVFVSRAAPSQGGYARVSPLLAAAVLADGQALLSQTDPAAHTLPPEESAIVSAQSVIVAPLRQGERVWGLFHVYALPGEPPLTQQKLGFVYAAAELLGRLLGRLQSAQAAGRESARLRDENRHLRQQLGLQSEIQGRSLFLARVTEQINSAAASKGCVLIRGEIGVGKDLVARAIHFSGRRSGPFVSLHCGGYRGLQLEEELLGRAPQEERQERVGRLEAAHGGTLFVDQVELLRPSLQDALLGIIEGRPFQRVGSNLPIKADLRIIAATTADLEDEVAQGRFRQDLFVRLQAHQVMVPALHRRKEDIPELARYFLRYFREELGRPVEDFSPSALQALQNHRWPGNVRELKNVVERAVTLSRGTTITPEDLLLPE